MKTRTWMMIVAVVLIVGLAVFNLLSMSGGRNAPLKGAEALVSLPDAQLEGAVLTELGRATYGEGTPPDAWRTMNPVARQLWSVAAIRDIDPVSGLGLWLKSFQAGATSPGPEDMRDGLAALGLDAARKVMDDIIANRGSTDQAALGKFHGQLGDALNDPIAQAARQKWVRAHLRDLLAR
jgi:hypothetical protein